MALLAAADDESRQVDALFNIKRADTFWAMNLMSADRNQIRPRIFQIHLAKALNGIGMKDSPPLQAANFLYRHNGSRLVVYRHDGNQCSLIVYGSTQLRCIETALIIHPDIRDVKSFFF